LNFLSLAMTDRQPDDCVLDAEHAAFIQRRVSMSVASCSSGGLPSLARAYGCRVSPDGRSVTVFVAVPRSQALLSDLRAGSGLAAVFSRPSTHETLQLKGTRAQVLPLADGDRLLMRAYGEGFAAELNLLGYRDPFTGTLMSGVEEEAAGLTFTLTAAFVQTPGPTAGHPIEPTP
jgi:hypothetical protein